MASEIGADRKHMGLDFGLEGLSACFPKRKNRWLFQVEGVSGVMGALPPTKASRPQFEFKEQQIAHLNQNVYFPVMIDFKPITLVLYDTSISIPSSTAFKATNNGVYNWITKVYNPTDSKNEWNPIYVKGSSENTGFKRRGTLCMYDGCGKVVETWIFENCYPQSVNFGDLDMADSSIVTLEVTLRYDRAYLKS